MKNFHSTIAIVLLSLFTCWDSGMSNSARIHVYNNQSHENIYISCIGNNAYDVSKQVPPSNKTEIPLPPHKVWPPVACNGKVNEVSYKEYPLYISMSSDRTKRCEKSCYFIVSNNSFYHWDQEKKTWVIVPPTIWYT